MLLPDDHAACCLQSPVRNWAWQPDDDFQAPAITPGQCEEQQLWDLPDTFFADGWRDYRCVMIHPRPALMPTPLPCHYAVHLYTGIAYMS